MHIVTEKMEAILYSVIGLVLTIVGVVLLTTIVKSKLTFLFVLSLLTDIIFLALGVLGLIVTHQR